MKIKKQPVRVFTFRPFRDLLDWLERQPDRTETINAALLQYRQGKKLDDAIVRELQEIKNLLKGESK